MPRRRPGSSASVRRSHGARWISWRVAISRTEGTKDAERQGQSLVVIHKEAGKQKWHELRDGGAWSEGAGMTQNRVNCLSTVAR